MQRFREEKRERLLSDAKRRRLGAALKESWEKGREPPLVITAIRLLMLTGCRKGAILTLQWEHVDLGVGELRLPGSKTGAKIVHLGDAAVAVLRVNPRPNDSPWVVTGNKSDKTVTRSPVLVASHPRAGAARIHDLRHSYPSDGLLVGEGLPMIGRLLGHPHEQSLRLRKGATKMTRLPTNRIATHPGVLLLK